MRRNVSYREIGGPGGLLARLEEFTGNSMHAVGDVDRDGYSVYSYETEIARVVRDPETGSFVAFHAETNRWSVTTARHLSLVRSWLPGTLRPLHSPRTGGGLSLPERFTSDIRNRREKRIRELLAR